MLRSFNNDTHFYMMLYITSYKCLLKNHFSSFRSHFSWNLYKRIGYILFQSIFCFSGWQKFTYYLYLTKTVVLTWYSFFISYCKYDNDTNLLKSKMRRISKSTEYLKHSMFVHIKEVNVKLRSLAEYKSLNL